jgi:pteridine reductase
MHTIRGKTALVTGAAKRIGRAIALALAQHGAHVVIHYHTSRAEAHTTAEDMRACGVKARTIQADLNDLEQAAAMLTELHPQTGTLDILINSASIFPADQVMDFSATSFQQNMAVNALAPLWLSRAFAHQTQSGAIINLLDTRILDYDASHTAYHLSKRTLFTLTKMLSRELAPGIRVNGVAPGLILPPPGKPEAYLQQFTRSNPLQRIGTLEDVTEAVLFLLRSDFITGQIIYVDGGRHLKGAMYSA